MLVTINFFSSHNIFERLYTPSVLNPGLFGKGSKSKKQCEERRGKSFTPFPVFFYTLFLCFLFLKGHKCKKIGWRAIGLTHYQTTNFRLFQTERVCRRQFQNLTKMEESYPNRWKTLWEKEKLLITSNFSFSHSVFKRLVSQGCPRGVKRCHCVGMG